MNNKEEDIQKIRELMSSLGCLEAFERNRLAYISARLRAHQTTMDTYEMYPFGFQSFCANFARPFVSFIWERTDEGLRFWSDINSNIKKVLENEYTDKGIGMFMLALMKMKLFKRFADNYCAQHGIMAYNTVYDFAEKYKNNISVITSRSNPFYFFGEGGCSFDWDATTEGYEFWHKVQMRLKNMVLNTQLDYTTESKKNWWSVE